MASVPNGINAEGTKRVIIEKCSPSVDCGRFPAKACVDFPVVFSAAVFADGHDQILASVLIKEAGTKTWREQELIFQGNDLWETSYRPQHIGVLEFKFEAIISQLASWKVAFEKKEKAGTLAENDKLVGIKLLQAAIKNNAKRSIKKETEALVQEKTRTGIRPHEIPSTLWQSLLKLEPKQKKTASATYKITVDPKKAQFSTWYELFPRSCSAVPGQHGTFNDVEKQLPRLAQAGFDVLYLPPIHPIGREKRKGKNNCLTATPGDPGSPWAIGNAEGGHKAIHSELGTLKDFKHLLKSAKKQNIGLAMDIAFQCAPDHPYIKNHPEWFKWLPDDTIQYAENPPKKYEDIVPFDFDTPSWESLWRELKSILDYWIGQGVTIFRVDNPHTKSLLFWEWAITKTKETNPEVIFLAEAFTRPHVMERLAKAGFTQSYTYFTWRTSKKELEEYLIELTQGEKRFFFRPNFWPNTPDILPPQLVEGGENASIIRLVLAATLSSNYGIYGPVFERGITASMDEKEEYRDNEKYEIKYWEPQKETRIWETITKVNHIRKEFAALQTTNNNRFFDTTNEQIIAFLKLDPFGTDHLIVIINLDAFHSQNGMVFLHDRSIEEAYGSSFEVEDLLSEEIYRWTNGANYVELQPAYKLAHILRFPKHAL